MLYSAQEYKLYKDPAQLLCLSPILLIKTSPLKPSVVTTDHNILTLRKCVLILNLILTKKELQEFHIVTKSLSLSNLSLLLEVKANKAG